MFETYPKKASAGKAGSKSGWTDGNGTRYPGTVPTKQDATGTVKCHEQLVGKGSPAKYDYPDRGVTANREFGNLNGLPG